MRFPFSISNWDVPPSNRHLAVQLSQLTKAISDWVPQFVDSTIDEDVEQGLLPDPQAVPSPSDETPEPVGASGTPGASDDYARGDHAHAIAQVSSGAQGVLQSTAGASAGDVATVQGDGTVAYETPGGATSDVLQNVVLLPSQLNLASTSGSWPETLTAVPTLTTDAGAAGDMNVVRFPSFFTSAVHWTMLIPTGATSVDILPWFRTSNIGAGIWRVWARRIGLGDRSTDVAGWKAGDSATLVDGGGLWSRYGEEELSSSIPIGTVDGTEVDAGQLAHFLLVMDRDVGGSPDLSMAYLHARFSS